MKMKKLIDKVQEMVADAVAVLMTVFGI